VTGEASALRTTTAPGIIATLVAGAALLVAAGSAVDVLTPGPAPVHIDGAATAAGSVAPLLLVAALTLVVAGVAAWTGRPGSGLALIAFGGAAALLAAILVGSAAVSREVRTLGLLLAPFAFPLLIHLPVRALRADRGLARFVFAGLYLATAVTATGHLVTWDPYLVADCAPMCHPDDNVLALHVDIPLSLGLRSAGWWLAVAGGAGLAAWATWRWTSRSRTGWADPTDRMVLLGALVSGLAMVAWGWARLRTSEFGLDDPWASRTTGLLAGSVAILGAGVAWMRFRETGRAGAVRGLVDLLDGGAGSRSLAQTLAAILDDPTVRIGYPLEGDGCVDDQGAPVATPIAATGRAVTPIERGGTVIALVEHAADLDPDLLSREVGAAARLAVDNERLAALLRAQVRELQASRERIVAAGDAARGRLERDLHDGAQQRLLAISYELRLAQAAAHDERPDRRAAIDASVTEIDAALAELRELAHGIWPAVLAEAGLEAALGSLADEASIPVTLEAVPEERFPARTESAAYLAVTEALRRATAGGAPGLAVRAQQVDDRLMVEVRAPGLVAPGPWLRVDDRVGAAGGRSVVTVDAAAGTLLSVELPCA